MAGKVDAEVRVIIDRNFERCKKLLAKHSKDLDILARGLLEYETLDAEQVGDLLHGRKVVLRNVDAARKKPAVAKPVIDALDNGQVQAKPRAAATAKPRKKSS
jgi:hypothetical protein